MFTILDNVLGLLTFGSHFNSPVVSIVWRSFGQSSSVKTKKTRQQQQTLENMIAVTKANFSSYWVPHALVPRVTPHFFFVPFFLLHISTINETLLVRNCLSHPFSPPIAYNKTKTGRLSIPNNKVDYELLQDQPVGEKNTPVDIHWHLAAFGLD